MQVTPIDSRVAAVRPSSFPSTESTSVATPIASPTARRTGRAVRRSSRPAGAPRFSAGACPRQRSSSSVEIPRMSASAGRVPMSGQEIPVSLS